MAEGRKLAANVNVGGVWYRAGDNLPAEVAEKVTNPKVFAPDDDGEQQEHNEPGTPSGARLAARVNVGGTWYGPDDAVPKEVAEKIRNPKAWEGGQVPTAAAGNEGADGDGTQPSESQSPAQPDVEEGEDTEDGDEPTAGTRARRGRRASAY